MNFTRFLYRYPSVYFVYIRRIRLPAKPPELQTCTALVLRFPPAAAFMGASVVTGLYQNADLRMC